MQVSFRFSAWLAMFPLAVYAAEPDDGAFYEAIRAILPPAIEKVPPPPAPAPEVAQQQAEQKVEMPAPYEYKPDVVRAADVSPAAHPEQFALFKEKLQEQMKANLYDFCPAMEVVLRATNDEFAAQVWMEAAAAEGIAPAMQYVADRNLTNIQADKVMNPEVVEAYRLVRKAADAGFDAAKVNVCMCMKMGIGTPKDEDAADKYIFEACKGGNMIPRFKWLQMSRRLVAFEDKERAEVKAEIERGNHHVAYFLARLAPDLEQRVHYMQLAAKAGNADALFALSAMAASKAPKDSLVLLKEAIRKHSAEAMFTLGTAVTDGDVENPLLKEAGITRDEVAGRHLVRLASMLGNIPAAFWLGNAYHDGMFGMVKDDARAYKHFHAGAMAGNPACGAALGLMTLRGIGTEADPRRGLYYLNVAASSGVSYAVVLLAYAQYEGLGVAPDGRKACDLLQEAAAMNQPAAYVYLAFLTAKGGAGMQPDEFMAARYLRMAALDMGDKAQVLYDKLMKEGKWVPGIMPEVF